MNSGRKSSSKAIHRSEVRSFRTERERTGSGNGVGLGSMKEMRKLFAEVVLAQTKKELSLPNESRFGREPGEG